jgi:hypothetical protein
MKTVPYKGLATFLRGYPKDSKYKNSEYDEYQVSPKDFLQNFTYFIPEILILKT